MPRVSIAIPTYNCGPYIAQSIESLLGQTYGDFELVISDNVSTDQTEEVCRRFEALDRRVRYVRRPDNIGGPGNFRYVFSLCTGEFHKWSTADDWWEPTFLAKAVSVLDSRRDVVLCYPRTMLVDMEGRPIRPYEDQLELASDRPSDRFLQLMATIDLCNAHLGLIRRDAMLKTGLIGPERDSDVYFLAELSLYGKFSVLPDRLFNRRFHDASSSWGRFRSDIAAGDRTDEVRQEAYYRPTTRADARLHTFTKYRRLYGAVLRSPIPATEKLRLAARMARWIGWDRRAIFQELRTFAHR